jgi:hypothetical protein
MNYNECKECPHYNKSTCPLSNFSQKLREQFCPSLKLKIIDTDQVDRMIDALQARLKVIETGLSTQNQPMDYSRDDTKQIVNTMRPYNN